MLFFNKLKSEVFNKIRKSSENIKLKGPTITGGNMKKSSIINITNYAKKIRPPVENMKILSFLTKRDI